jgi:hypothetical protein
MTKYLHTMIRVSPSGPAVAVEVGASERALLG